MAYIIGTNGKNVLLGTAENDILIGYGGADRLDGGLGSDILLGGLGADIFVFRPGEGMDVIGDADTSDVLVVEEVPVFDVDWITRDGQDLVISFADNGGYVLDPLSSVRVLNHFAGSPLTRVVVDTAFNLGNYGIEQSFTTFFIAAGTNGRNQGDNPEVILGTNADETFTTNGGLWDMVIAGGGDDLIRVTAGTQRSLIRPGDGNDTVLGGDGNDTVRGSQGADRMDGGAGFDWVDFRDSDSGVTVNLGITTGQYVGAYDGGDTIRGFEGVFGSRWSDSIKGSAGDDWLVGRDGRDTLDGGAGADTMEGGHDNDTYFVDNPADVVREVGGSLGGNDEVRASVSYTLTNDPNYWFIERLTLIGTALNGTGNDVPNVIRGNALANVLNGMNGNDQLYGGAGADTLNGGFGNDRLIGNAGVDVMTGGTGADRFEWNTVAEGGVGAGSRDRITDFEASDTIDLRRIDANPLTPEDDAFALVTGAFTTPGQLTVTVTGGNTILALNTDADADAEMEIELTGFAGTLTLSSILF